MYNFSPPERNILTRAYAASLVRLLGNTQTRPRRDTNPQTHQASDRRPAPETVRPMASVDIQGYYKRNRHFQCSIETKLLII
jgi:hypothetical protein